MSIDSSIQQTLIEALLNPRRFPHPVEDVERLETHISTVLLAGEFAYKIKKPLNLGFLDFSSLASRKYYCEEELRLNRRLAPALYLDCIPICGSPENPLLGGNPAEAIEYAVKMVRFPQDNLLDRCLARGGLEPRHFDDLASRLAEFHETAARADPDSPHGTPERIRQTTEANFTTLRPRLGASEDRRRLEHLERWTTSNYASLKETMAWRKTNDFIREGHGDLHLGNIILENDRVVVFDCIEFNDDLRWIDIINDLAFLLMDLHRHGAPALAWRLLNKWLEGSGDYAGLKLLPHYLAYRAMVRAMVAAIRLDQTEPESPLRAEGEAQCRGYLDLALSFTRRTSPFLLITHGVSGSGKSFSTGRLLESLGAIRIRSDVERKRLFGLKPDQKSGSALDQGLYTRTAGIQTYQRLRDLADRILDAGWPVMVDATFLESERRQEFRALAEAKDVPFILLACTADPETSRRRIRRRQARGDDAAEAGQAVLEQQLQRYSAPSPEENPLITGNTDAAGLAEIILARVRHRSYN